MILGLVTGITTRLWAPHAITTVVEYIAHPFQMRRLGIALSHQAMSVLGIWPSSGDAVLPPDPLRVTP